MYFNKNNNFFHGIMFHHFHDGLLHTKGQGSISKDEFYKIINFIGKKNILNADVFFEKFIQGNLKKNEVCITFDDAIKCQIDVALPVLEDLQIKGFFFIYTSMFEGKPDNLEIYRYFRMNYFKNINDFYLEFYSFLDEDTDLIFKRYKDEILFLKERYQFYTIDDIKFRIVRDNYLKKADYEIIMFDMIRKKINDHEKILNSLFFDKEDLLTLDSCGHTIGLHTHTHPTNLSSLTYNEQKLEYSNCLNILSKILRKPSNFIKTASHPLGSYNNDSLKILDEMGIELAFKDSMVVEKEKGMNKINNSNLEIARCDHAEVLKMMSS